MLRLVNLIFGLMLSIQVASASELPSGNLLALVDIRLSTSSGIVDLRVEVADTPSLRQQGLMMREDLPQGQGMLFVFDDLRRRSFWMKNTPLSLDILFFDDQGYWINSHLGTTPFSTKSLRSVARAQYALEVKAGEASRLNLGEGTKLHLPDDG